MSRLSTEEMYQAVVANAAQYDGVFYYAVKTTGIVCRPSCKSKAPNRANVVFFATLDEALQQGYRACKRCRPDLGPHYHPEADVLSAAVAIMNRKYARPALLQELPGSIGVSASHLQRLFKKSTGQTPKKYLQRLRISKATALLSKTAMNVIDVGLAVGFANLSSFYAAFRDVTGLPPTQYRHMSGNSPGDRAI